MTWRFGFCKFIGVGVLHTNIGFMKVISIYLPLMRFEIFYDSDKRYANFIKNKFSKAVDELVKDADS